MPNLLVLIPTYSRIPLLRKALQSVASQTIAPDKVLVVGESERDLPLPADRKCLESSLSPVRLEWLTNERDPGMGGSLNTGLLHVLQQGANPMDTYVAFLDDDDTWDSGYLEHIRENIEGRKHEVVVTGLLRHDSETEPPIPHAIPELVTSHEFLVGNPHVQNSNLVVRLDVLLLAGGWDEALQSTHDRDLMLRILDLPRVTFGFVRHHLVHYWALDHQRLSTRGSAKKAEGLRLFLRKYRHRMGDGDLLLFRERAHRLFGIDDLDFPPPRLNPTDTAPPSVGPVVDLVVGFTVSRRDCGTRLCKDIAEYLTPTGHVKAVVVMDNLPEGDSIESVVSSLRGVGVRLRIVTQSDVKSDADSGRLTSYYVSPGRRQGVAFGRTALHRYLHKEAAWFPDSVVWILDDDIRLNPVHWGLRERALSADELLSLLAQLRREGVTVAVGGIAGDPPLPAAMTVRGQLLDLSETLRILSSGNGRHTPPPTVVDDTMMRERFPEYYHDLSMRHHGHLETPFGLPESTSPDNTKCVDEETSELLRSIAHGRSVSRPSPTFVALDETALPTRGGNAFVFNPDYLRAVPNLSPQIGETSCRRGDTLWCMALKRLGGALVGEGPGRVISVPLFARQERGADVEQGLDWEKLRADVLGRALTRALDPVFKHRGESLKDLDLTALLSLSESEIETVAQTWHDLVERQIGDLTLMAWRVRGLGAIADLLLEERELTESRRELNHIVDFYGRNNAEKACKDLGSVPLDDLRRFLRDFPRFQREFSRSLHPIVSQGWMDRQRLLIETSLGMEKLSTVGRGDEGVVFSDGNTAVKCFFDGTAHLSPSQIDFLASTLGTSQHLTAVVPVHRVWKEGSSLALVTDFIRGPRFSGGQGEDFFDLLLEARRHGFVIKNVSPDNLVRGEKRLVYVDLGDDIVPYTEAGFRQMAKRVFLTYQWHFRSDLKLLLRASLTNEDLPELAGFPYFWEALHLDRVDAITDPLALEMMKEVSPQTILDIGCGDGRLSRQMASLPSKVLGFDPAIDNGTVACSSDGEFSTMDRTGLEDRLRSGPVFEATLLSMVLCEVQSEAAVEDLLATARKGLGEGGNAILSFCSPFQRGGLRSALWSLGDGCSASYQARRSSSKTLRQNDRERTDRFRPLSWYSDALHRAGFVMDKVQEGGSVDLDGFLPSGEVLAIRARAVARSRPIAVSLLIKACPLEWRTIDAQVRHLVRQLEGPQHFTENVVVADIHDGPFNRLYDQPDSQALVDALERLRRDGVVDRVVVPPRTEKSILEMNRPWFGLESSQPMGSRGEATYSFLTGLEECVDDFVLHTDSDCLVGRPDRGHDYLADMVSVMEEDPTAVTVAFGVPQPQRIPFTAGGPNGPWRVESRLGLVSRDRLRSLRPLPNQVGENGRLSYSWYRSLDQVVAAGRVKSYRGGDPRAFFVHVPNTRKRPVNGWFNILQAIERGYVFPAQLGKVDLVGDTGDWVGRREENLVFVVRGRDVPLPKLRRCIGSLLSQHDQTWGVVFVDGGSKNGMDEYLRYVALPQFGRRASLLLNLEPLLPIQNITQAVREICSRPDSIIATLDADDALLSPFVVDRVRDAYAQGADLTVGSMVRTDKEASYPVDLVNPRGHRGGNVWQHLRTFRKSLFDQLNDEDLKVHGSWVPLADDWAFMVPMVEMARHPTYLKEKLYLYDPSPAHDARDRDLSETIISAIMAKPSKKWEATS